MSSSGSSFLFVDAPGNNNKPRVKYVDDNAFNYKIVVVGPAESGKTQFIQKFITFECQDREVYIKKLQNIEQARGINLPKSGKLEIWDVLNSSNKTTKQFYRNSLGAFVVFDLTDKYSFEQVDTWIQEIKENCPEETPITIVGNKMDLAEREIQEEDVMEKFNDMFQTYDYVEVSAETGENITEKAFMPMVQLIQEKLQS